MHPGETTGSHIMRGLIEFLSANEPNKKFSLNDIQIARELRKRFTFKIVPMLNPDGVIMGNNRVSISGSDLNRKYLNPNINLHPEIFFLKDLVSTLVEQNKKPYLYIDIHSHS